MSKRKLERLTPEQEAALPRWRDMGLKIGLSTSDELPPKETLRPLVDAVYAEAKLPAPKFIIYVDSPFAGCIASAMLKNMKDLAAHQVEDQVRDQVWGQVRDQVGGQVWGQVEDQVWGQVRGQVGGQVEDQVWGQVRGQVGGQVEDQVWGQVRDQVYSCGYGLHDMHWLMFYEYFRTEAGIQTTVSTTPLLNFSKEVGWWWPFDNAVIVSPKPTHLSMQNGRLHNTTGPAVRYKDGFGVYAMNGVRFTGDMIRFVTTPSKDLDSKAVLAIRNVEQRSEVIKKIGIKSFINDLNPQKLDDDVVQPGGHYELIQVQLPSHDIPCRYLKFKHSGTNEDCIEAVHPECRTVHEALNWREQGRVKLAANGYLPPLVRT